MNINSRMDEIGAAARRAASQIAAANAAQKHDALCHAAAALRRNMAQILSANARDIAENPGLTEALRDRLLLTEARIEAIAAGMEAVAALPDPVGRVLEHWGNPANGLRFEKRAVPLGVIGMIYESRPNVTADAAALALKSGNSIILRGGSESLHSSLAIAYSLQQGLAAAGLPQEAVQLVATTDRAAVTWMLNATGVIDVLIPRGGKSLTSRVQSEARVPTLLHLDGNCHVYIHAQADAAIAQQILLNAKLRRTGICGAAESLLIDEALPKPQQKALLEALLDGGCEVRADAALRQHNSRIIAATEEDWSTEYLAPVISARTVAGVAEAIAHINRYGSHHTDAIVTSDTVAAQQFCAGVDSAIVLVNASTQFADGGEFGFGGEIGIATGRLHARGPVGARELTTYKYVVTPLAGGGAVRQG